MKDHENDLIPKEIHTPPHSVADAESLLNTLLMLNTFLIGFSITFASNQNYNDLLAMDTRFLTTYYSNEIAPYFSANIPDVVIMSAILSYRSVNSLIFFTCSLFIGIGCLLGLNFSDCREDLDYFNEWILYTKFIILFGYLLFIAGFVYLYGAIIIAIFASFPKYCGLKQDGYAYVSTFEEVFNATSQSMIQGCVVQNLRNHQGGTSVSIIDCLAPIIVLFLILWTRNFQTIIVLFSNAYQKIFPRYKKTISASVVCLK